MVVLYSEPSPEHQERHRRRRPAAVRYGPAPADDVGGLPATVLEMKLLEEAGLSRLAAHETATVNPAKLMGAADRSSSVQPSFFADLIAVTTTPWTTWPPSALSVSCYRRAGP